MSTTYHLTGLPNDLLSSDIIGVRRLKVDAGSGTGFTYASTQRSDQGVYSFTGDQNIRNLSVVLNGGSLTIELWDGSAYVLSDTITSDGTKQVNTWNSQIRITPISGAVYSIVSAAEEVIS